MTSLVAELDKSLVVLVAPAVFAQFNNLYFTTNEITRYKKNLTAPGIERRRSR